MRIAISSEGDSLDSKVSPISGRAPYYLVFENDELVKKIKNPFRIGSGGAGFSVAQMLADENINLVISGRFGENMKNTLNSKNIKYTEVSEISVKEALKNAQT